MARAPWYRRASQQICLALIHKGRRALSLDFAPA
jgi:hypothetical protein